MNTKELIEEVAALPVEERAIVADSILQSLNTVNLEIEKEWVQIAKQRLNELRSGAVKAVPGSEVFNKIFQRYSK